MTINLHAIDRALRAILGLVLVSLAFFGPENLWYLAGLIPLITGSIGICPLYKVLNISTCPVKRK